MMSYFGKRKSLKNPWEQETGQAIVEYLLLVVVILSIGYALARNFFEPLQRYGSSVFSSTIACSLEYGQLPAEIKSEDGCAASLQANFSGTTRRQSVNNNQTNKNTAPTDAAKKSENAKNKPPSETGRDTQVNRGRSASGSSSSEGLKLGKPTGTDAKTLGKNEKIVDEANRSGADNGDSSFVGRQRRRSLTKPISGALEIAIDAKKHKEREVRRSISEVPGLSERKAKRFNVNTQKKDKASESANDTWDISKIIRMALIILMFLAIIIFVLFQVAQIRKGAES